MCHPIVPAGRGRSQLPWKVPSSGPASHLSPEAPVPGGILPDLRDDHGRVRPPGAVEEERAEEAGPAVLSAVHYKYIHTYKYIHRETSIWQLCMILGAVAGPRGPLCTPESELESCTSFGALCFLSFSSLVPVSIPGFSPHSVSVTAAPQGHKGRIFLLQPQSPGLAGSRGLGWGLDWDVPAPSAQLGWGVGVEKALGTRAGKWDLTPGSLNPSLPSHGQDWGHFRM